MKPRIIFLKVPDFFNSVFQNKYSSIDAKNFIVKSTWLDHFTFQSKVKCSTFSQLIARLGLHTVSFFTILNNKLFQNHHSYIARTEQSFLFKTDLRNLPFIVGELNQFLVPLQRHFSFLKKFVDIWKSGSSIFWLIFTCEGLLMTLKRRITFFIKKQTEHLISVKLPHNQAKCFMCKSTVETRVLFVNLVISRLILQTNIQSRFL